VDLPVESIFREDGLERFPASASVSPRRRDACTRRATWPRMVARRARCKVTSPAGGRAGPAQLPRRRSRRRRALQTKPAPKTPGTPTWSDSACCAPRCARDSWRREDPCQEQVLPAALSHARREGEQNSRTGGPKPNFSKLNYSRISELFSLLSEHISTVVREGRILEFSSRSSFFFLSGSWLLLGITHVSAVHLQPGATWREHLERTC
jgi:hypothetical protein